MTISYIALLFSPGIIGPDTATNAEAVHKITSVLKVPHIVRRESNSPYLHHLVKESDSYLVQVTNCLLTRTSEQPPNNEIDTDVYDGHKILYMSKVSWYRCKEIECKLNDSKAE